ncbi:hypothetical protein PENTCL1PPCAC_14696, partial [Pristionchus entomophagus]
MPITDSDRHAIYAGVIVFNVFGLFGNLNVIYAHYRLKALRTKYGAILTMLVSAHTICLLYELAGMVYNISGAPLIRRNCFYFISPYLFTYCLQVSLMAAISTDMLISIAAPLQHRIVRRRTYLSLLVLPGFIYGTVSLYLGFVYADHSKISMCQLPSSFPFSVEKIWHLIGLVFTIVTVASYIAAFTILYCKHSHLNSKLQLNNGNIERKAMKSLSILIIVFICER